MTVQELLFIQNSIAGDMTVKPEVESIFSCDYPKMIFLHLANIMAQVTQHLSILSQMDPVKNIGEAGHTHEAIFSDKAGIVKVYEAITQYCGSQILKQARQWDYFLWKEK